MNTYKKIENRNEAQQQDDNKKVDIIELEN